MTALIAKAVVVAASVWDEDPPPPCHHARQQPRRTCPLHGFASTAVVIPKRRSSHARNAARKVLSMVPRAPGSGSPARPQPQLTTLEAVAMQTRYPARRPRPL
jgi:hypothetical protein